MFRRIVGAPLPFSLRVLLLLVVETIETIVAILIVTKAAQHQLLVT